jgi:glycosyltransferase involved in cell wall biosynthesis
MTVVAAHGLPTHLLPGDPRHGVTVYAATLARALGAPTATGMFPDPVPRSMHLHLTDRILASSPAGAAELVERLAVRTRLTITAHDVPQPTDGRGFAERRAAYRRMLLAADGWVTSSRHEQGLVAEHCGVEDGVVIPLPVIAPDSLPVARTVVRGPTIGLFGHVYPGKGHVETVEAVSRLRGEARSATVLLIGGPGPGHEHEVDQLGILARTLGVRLHVTGWLDDDLALATMRGATVAVTGHRNLSASGSINSWVAAGRRPLVRDNPYARELQRLRPDAHHVYRDEELVDQLERSLADPSRTWRTGSATPGPDQWAVAASYADWWGSR